MFQALISPIASLAGTWLEGKVSKAKAETEVKVARAKAEAKVYETEATSSMLNEQSLTSQMGESWKDEFWSLIFGAILICCFLPWTQPYVKEGFVFLQVPSNSNKSVSVNIFSCFKSPCKNNSNVLEKTITFNQW